MLGWEKFKALLIKQNEALLIKQNETKDMCYRRFQKHQSAKVEILVHFQQT